MSIKVEVFSSPGCGKCGQAKTVLKKTVEAMSNDQIEWREVNILEELDYAVSLGVVTTPAIAIDGQLCFTGLPSVKVLQERLKNKLERSA